MMRAVPALVALGCVLVAGCADDGESGGAEIAPTVSAPSTAPVAVASTIDLDRDEFRRSVEAICADVTDALVDRAPLDGASPAAAATVLRSMVDANREGVDRLRALDVPAELDEEFASWLDLVDETAAQLEVGSLALRAGDEEKFAQALGEAQAVGAQASTAALELGLPDCAFSG